MHAQNLCSMWILGEGGCKVPISGIKPGSKWQLSQRVEHPHMHTCKPRPQAHLLACAIMYVSCMDTTYSVLNVVTYHAMYTEEKGSDSKPLSYSNGLLRKVPDMLTPNSLHSTKLILTSIDIDHLHGCWC